LLQLEDEQLLQELPVPAIGIEVPLLSLAKEANREKIRLEAFWHFGHEAFLSA